MTLKHREPPIVLSEEAGVRYLHFGSPWVQGAMRLSRPFDIEIDYVRQMMAWLLFLDPPARLLQLGLGAAALTKFCWRGLPSTQLTVVENSRAVIDCARSQFALPADDPRLRVVAGDAGAFVARRAERGRYGVIQIDLYDRKARGPVLDSPAFYRACHAALQAPGILVVNLFGEAASFERSERRLADVFDGRTLALPPVPAGNVVLLAFKGPPLSVDWERLARRARDVRRTWRLPADDWYRAVRNRQQGFSEFFV
ncbi:MAG: spermidine synthase [Burkholderiaceae bacterium]